MVFASLEKWTLFWRPSGEVMSCQLMAVMVWIPLSAVPTTTWDSTGPPIRGKLESRAAVRAVGIGNVYDYTVQYRGGKHRTVHVYWYIHSTVQIQLNQLVTFKYKMSSASKLFVIQTISGCSMKNINVVFLSTNNCTKNPRSANKNLYWCNLHAEN
jgi:hypothetical protein